jgi:hypothetical protein
MISFIAPFLVHFVSLSFTGAVPHQDDAVAAHTSLREFKNRAATGKRRRHRPASVLRGGDDPLA